MEETKRIKLYVEEKTTADGSRKFNVYKSVTKNGRKIDVKFRKTCKSVPTENSYITVKVDNMNMQKNTEFPILWINEIEKSEPMNDGFDKEANAKTINEWF